MHINCDRDAVRASRKYAISTASICATEDVLDKSIREGLDLAPFIFTNTVGGADFPPYTVGSSRKT